MQTTFVLTTLLVTLFAFSAAVPVKREDFEELVQFLNDFTVEIPDTNRMKRTPTRINYIGCFPFKADFFKDLKNDASMESCVAYCKTKDYGYAGLLFGQYCVCEDSAERYDSKRLDESMCSATCAGDSAQICGGEKSLSTYDTDGRYQGCFPFEMDYLKNYGDSNSISKCLLHCFTEGYDFVGVLNAQFCFCDNSYQKYIDMGSLDKSECSSPCPGNEAQECGANDNMAYYGIEGSECLGDCATTGNLEGDIKRSEDELTAIRVGKTLSLKQAVVDTSLLWPSGVVMYELASTVLPIKDKILEAMKHISSNTCIKFFQYTDPNGLKLIKHKNRIVIKKLDGCWSSIGMSMPLQEVSIGYGCEYLGVIVHELVHTLGVYHQQSRSDRDSYVKINWDNIEFDMESQFEIESDTTTYNLPYDYASIMHYGRTYFSKNGKDTITTKNAAAQNIIGGRQALSPTDIKLINTLYKCPPK